MTLLLLAGTGEARRMATLLADEGISTIASLAGSTRNPIQLSVPTRHGGFGGREGFEAYLTKAGIRAVLDATHPFAHRISQRTASICDIKALPYAQILRQEWRPEDGDRWFCLSKEEDAADHIPVDATVFLATGRQTLERFSNLAGRRLICRQIDPPERPFPFTNGEFLVGRPPFSVEDEVKLFSKLGVDWLVVKNAGGTASRTKLTAARLLNIPVAMIARPPQPTCTKLETVEAALKWVRALSW